MWVDLTVATPLNAPAPLRRRQNLARWHANRARHPRSAERHLDGGFRRETMTHMTFDPSVDECPAWTLDSKRIIWASLRATGTPVLFSQSADATGPASEWGLPPTRCSRLQSHRMARSSPGRTGPASSQDILRSIDHPKKHPARHHTGVRDRRRGLAHGRWLAYESNESGRNEIYVRPFPSHAGHCRFQPLAGPGRVEPKGRRNLLHRQRRRSHGGPRRAHGKPDRRWPPNTLLHEGSAWVPQHSASTFADMTSRATASVF